MVPARSTTLWAAWHRKSLHLGVVPLLAAVPLLVAEVVAEDVVRLLYVSGFPVFLLQVPHPVAPLALPLAGIALRGQQVAQPPAVAFPVAVGVGLGVALVHADRLRSRRKDACCTHPGSRPRT